ncbi:MAG TPA: YbjN domain-containing protein [Ktedonobacteraceae bacterium]|jgi:hypothetical protein|nr:YbjN domain-containing protein [Ktedonobacteraceae bacterium]
MADGFGISQLVDYLYQMGVRIANLDANAETIELIFHSKHGQWRMILGFQQHDEVRKLMLVVPHINTVTTNKRLECLEALLAVNFRIAMGKFGLDLEDGEVRLEETVPLARDSITKEQFRLAFGALMQTVAMYHNLIPRIVYGNMTPQQALQACEQEYFAQAGPAYKPEPQQEPKLLTAGATETSSTPPELDVNDVLAEVARILEGKKD